MWRSWKPDAENLHGSMKNSSEFLFPFYVHLTPQNLYRSWYSQLLQTIAPWKRHEISDTSSTDSSQPSINRSKVSPFISRTQVSPQEVNYPKVKYWYRHQWDVVDHQNPKNKGADPAGLDVDRSQDSSILARGGSDASLGRNRALRWVQDENGITIDGW